MATAESKSSPRQDRRKARTRARILDAAEEFFASSDPESATIARIAEAADVAVATVYQHFVGKDDLHLAVVERALEHNERQMLAVYDSELLPELKLIDAAGAYLRFYLESPQLFRVIALRQGRVSEESTDSPVAVMMAERVDRMTHALARVINDGIDGGSLRPVAPLDTARFLWGAFNGVIGLALRPDRLRLDEHEMRTALSQGIEVIFDGLVGDRLRGADGRLAPELRRRLHTVLGSNPK
ncbi:MAG TPA: TetR/AcrR family transcriptional regulator [Pseudonocardia sp.]|uniref:TetR/AcrR family transcriptional regulator n=1 Tax=Pseudonocardia sp. TaxID=60912 RepID=UPI002B967427|nr:TetR/AcrR family transcriptional regulator [Pseudonocardia sp.]HTF53842.1 TetR/AcrR family transcriptional regulator [Pseudonocardia sp.]